MQNFQNWNACVLSWINKTHLSLKKFYKVFFPELELLPNNRESTPPTDSNQENTKSTCEDRNKLVVDKL